jgi:hypothetical protein
MKVLKFIIEGVYWLNIFIVPVALLAIPGFIIHHLYNNRFTLLLFLCSCLSGCVLGFLWAEKTRKTIGCSTFVNRIFSSEDVDLNQRK